MMIICESGSTKADWAIVKNVGEITYTESIGINPLFHDVDFIVAELSKNALLSAQKDAPMEIHYYGTSCSAEVRNQIIRNGLGAFFKHATIEVSHDLDGAVYAVAKKGTPAIVNILGTGSNSCFYDGTAITQQIGGNGFIISDEASGAYFGKVLIGDYLNHLLPKNIEQYMTDELGLTRDELLDNIYKKPNANVYLSQFTKVYSLFKNEAYVQETLMDGFVLFIDKHISRFPYYEQVPTHFIGSIAFHFKEILKAACESQLVNFGNVIQRPLDGLLQYHLENK